jgi:hypothetical protein
MISASRISAFKRHAWLGVVFGTIFGIRALGAGLDGGFGAGPGGGFGAGGNAEGAVACCTGTEVTPA